ncbi:beta/gamma crystallin-related protein [Erythrobacter donghaensis]|uniref:beta/gamma crystallin-related protein n=1 Tax=Erythrobacter donghaensis TaxID=267135 RepID=UPI000A38AC93|nr:beta/gamma crystallin-related protein [Erythrobacter donghaensis]
MKRGLRRPAALAAIPLFAVAALVGADIGSAQTDKMARPAEATIYRDAGFNGPAVFVGEAKPDLGLAWPVNSIRVTGGTWELCERSYYRGNCKTYTSDQPVLQSPSRGMTFQSMRPIGRSGGSFIGVEARDQVTSGLFAEFHTEPGTRGYRIPACPMGRATAKCAARTADNYCKAIGWNGSAREHMQTVGRVVFLADVLCVKSNF